MLFVLEPKKCSSEKSAPCLSGTGTLCAIKYTEKSRHKRFRTNSFPIFSDCPIPSDFIAVRFALFNSCPVQSSLQELSASISLTH